jgi:2-oxoglutarate dehydrogenase E1 component
MTAMKQFLSSSYLFGGNAPFIEELYESYLDNPQSVPEGWREYFDRMQVLPAPGGTAGRDVAHTPVVESFALRAGRLFTPGVPAISPAQVFVQQLIRVRFRRAADLILKARRPHIRTRFGFCDPPRPTWTECSMPAFPRRSLTLRSRQGPARYLR